MASCRAELLMMADEYGVIDLERAELKVLNFQILGMKEWCVAARDSSHCED